MCPSASFPSHQPFVRTEESNLRAAGGWGGGAKKGGATLFTH